MASGYRTLINGVPVDLDDQFDPDVVGDGPTAPTYKAGGTALKYADIKYGVKGPDCGFKEGGVDLSNKWAKKGSAAYKLPCDGDTANAAEVLTNGETGYAYAEFVIKADGSFVLRTIRSPNPSINDTNVLATGTWNTLGGASSGYQVRYTLSNIQYPTGSSSGASSSNDAAAFAVASTDRSVRVRVDGAFADGSRSITADLKIELKRSADGFVFSTTTVNLQAHIDGSV